MIRVDHVSRTFGTGASAVHAVREVDLEVATGSLTIIVGSSGSGKSTLLNMVGTLDQPTSGRVLVDDTDVYALDDDARTRFRRDRIGFVFQFFNLLPTLSAIENVTLPAELRGDPARKTRERAQALLERVGLGKRTDHRPDELSGGEMQRVAIARALVLDPPILLADEPTGNLDSTTGREILALLRGTVEAKRTVVLVTHDPSIAEQGDRVITMADGQVVSDVAHSATTAP